MKQQLKIVSSLILFFAMHVSFANGTETAPKKSQEQEQGALQTGQKGDIDRQQMEDGTKSYESEIEEPAEPVEEVKSDSVEDDSVSKYNFIFYFLYKFKYEAEA